MFSGSNKQFSKVFRYSVWSDCMTRPRYCYLFSTTTKSSKQFFFAKFALKESLVRNTEVNTFVLGIQGQKTSQNPKHFRNPKTRSKIQNTSSSGTCFWILGSVLSLRATVNPWLVGTKHFPESINTSQNPESGKRFGF